MDSLTRANKEGNIEMQVVLRNEMKDDYRRVEEITREAFWNLYVPGCNEHYLAHVMRNHKDFVKDLDFVAFADDHLVGNIMYTKSSIEDENGREIETISFGPVSVLPEYQKKGIGSSLIRHTIQKAKENRCKAIIIYGHPQNYCKHGFKSSRDFTISTVEGKYPYGLLVLELEKGVFDNNTWKYKESDVYNIDTEKAEEFDKTFEYKEKGYRYTQEEFSIASRAYIEGDKR